MPRNCACKSATNRLNNATGEARLQANVSVAVAGNPNPDRCRSRVEERRSIAACQQSFGPGPPHPDRAGPRRWGATTEDCEKKPLCSFGWSKLEWRPGG